jgi:hypothetical protein
LAEKVLKINLKAVSALGVGMLAFIFLKQGSGLLLILEGIIALSLMLLGVGARLVWFLSGK